VNDNRERRSRLLRGLTKPAQDGLANVQYRVLGEQQQHGYQHIHVQW
jgi:hypothetical protein